MKVFIGCVRNCVVVVVVVSFTLGTTLVISFASVTLVNLVVEMVVVSFVSEIVYVSDVGNVVENGVISGSAKMNL